MIKKCVSFLDSLYDLIFCWSFPSLSHEAIKASHTLLGCVLNRMVLKEISYQKTLIGFNSHIASKKRKLFPPYPIFIRYYNLTNFVWANMEGESMLIYHFLEESFQQHDPLNIVKSHNYLVKISFPYQHEENNNENPKKGVIYYDEVVEQTCSKEENKERKKKERTWKAIA